MIWDTQRKELTQTLSKHNKKLNYSRNKKLFLVSSSSTTSIVSTTTLCYVSAATLTACRRRRRALDGFRDTDMADLEIASSPVLGWVAFICQTWLYMTADTKQRWGGRRGDSPIRARWADKEGWKISTLLDDNDINIHLYIIHRNHDLRYYHSSSNLNGANCLFKGSLECTPSGFTLSLCGK